MAEIQTPMRAGAHVFELTGGSLCLDFANTVDNRPTLHTELLPDYAALVEWGRQAGVISNSESGKLLRMAAQRPQEVKAVLTKAKRLREEIFRVFSALANVRSLPPNALDNLNAFVPSILARSRLAAAKSGFSWAPITERTSLDSILWWVSRSVVDLLISCELQTLRECAAPNCSWLFLDKSKNGIRRWCDMKTCGNRDKVRRFRMRHSKQLQSMHTN